MILCQESNVWHLVSQVISNEGEESVIASLAQRRFQREATLRKSSTSRIGGSTNSQGDCTMMCPVDRPTSLIKRATTHVHVSPPEAQTSESSTEDFTPGDGPTPDAVLPSDRSPESNLFVREWRLKWSTAQGRASLLAAQKAVDELMGEVKQAPGYVRTMRSVCPTHKDFKVSTVVCDQAAYDAWEAAHFSPEEKLLEALQGITGVSHVEVQSFILS